MHSFGEKICRLLLGTVVIAGLAAAQDPPGRIGRLRYVSGQVSFQPAGVTDWGPASVNRPLTIGDQLFADNGGRAEVVVPGAAFRLGDRTAFEFMNLDDQNIQVRLSEGTLDVRVRNMHGNIEIATPNLSFTPTRPGEYRIDTNPDTGQTYVTVREGDGQVMGASGSFDVQMGQQAVVAGQDQSAQYQVYNAPGNDSFDNWVVDRDHHEDRYARSRYVSPEMVGYEDLDQYGSWRHTRDYGDMWVPGGIASGWAPYQDGHWAWVDPWGWTWVDNEPWGFAPFHYGRWAYAGGTWGWCPGPIAQPPVYAPAMVAWLGFGGGVGISVGFGGGPAVGWLPLGPRDVYIPAYAASAAYVNRVNVTNTTIINTTNITNVYSTYRSTGAIPVTSYMNRSVPGAVMAVPQNALANAQPVRQVAVKVQPNQIAAVKGAVSAPRVAPQVASVLGHAPAANAPRPSPAVLNGPVVAKRQPPPPPPSFQARQSLLQKDPGRPIPVAQLHQLAHTAPTAAAAARPPVHVVAQAPRVTPQVVKGPAPPPSKLAKAAAPQAAPATPPRPGQPATPAQPPTAAQRTPPAPGRPVPGQPAQPPAAAQRPAQAPNRQFEPPAAQQRAAQPGHPVPGQPAHPPAAAQRPPQTPNRPFEPPAAQQHAAQPGRPAPGQPARPNEPAAQQRAAQPPQPAPAQPGRATPPAAPQHAAQPAPRQVTPAARPAPPAQAQRPAPAPREAPPAQAQHRPAQQAPAPAPRGQAERAAPPAHVAPPPPAHVAPQQHPAPPPHTTTTPERPEQKKQEKQEHR